MPRALCIDLDDTLVRGNLLLEALMVLFKRNPLYVFLVPLWYMRGSTALKAKVAERVELDPEALPYDREILARLQSERQQGRSIWLCTTPASERLGIRIAEHLGLFEGVLPGDDRTNLAGAAKAAQLTRRFGEGNFDTTIEGASRSHSNTVRAIGRALRPHQWAKNGLVLVPFFASHRSMSLENLTPALLAVAAFCLGASSVYVINDLLDLAADRVHSRKRKRPFASGDLSIFSGWTLAPVLLATAIGIAAYLPAKFQVVFAAYYLTTLAYSLVLKERVLLDTMTLAALYTLRVIAGSAAVSVPLSFWLLLFSVFLFLSLAFVKRFAEVDDLRRQNLLRAAGRDYHVQDLSLLQSLGVAAGYLSVLVLALYINSPEIAALYRRPKIIWVLCVLMLYWVSRVWVKAQRGQMHDDPVVFALKDPVSLGVGLLAAITVALAI
jgi:4-hydroxybenzoate polyprenyltransferase